MLFLYLHQLVFHEILGIGEDRDDLYAANCSSILEDMIDDEWISFKSYNKAQIQP